MVGDLKLKRKRKKNRLSIRLVLLVLISASALGAFTSKIEQFKNRNDKYNNDKSIVVTDKKDDIKNDALLVKEPEKKEPEKKVEEPKVEEKKQEEKKDTSQDTKTTTGTTNLETKERDWFYIIKKDGSPSGIPDDVAQIINKHGGYYLGNTQEKIIYLTFDQGYENGYTGKILDTLKENDVKAAFFLVKPYINSNKDLVKRMVDEGHVAANHSDTHPSMAQKALKGKEAFEAEFTATEKAFEDLTGKKMAKFFRPPMGKYSELSLEYTKELGYKSIFWSFAYNDWDVNKQPTHDYAKKVLLERAHSGGIYLLHSVSKTNAEILDWFIKDAKSKGYRFASLEELS